MGIKDKWNTEEYKNYNRAIVKLLGESLKEGEFFIFSKKGEYGMILSEERLKGAIVLSGFKNEKSVKCTCRETGWE